MYGVQRKTVTASGGMELLDWYHGPLTRHHAEALLMSSGKEGSFLLRDIPGGAYCISARSKDDVKHFKVDKSESGFTFAHAEFEDLGELLNMFANQVVLCGQVGGLWKNFEQGTYMTLKYPYPRIVEEPDNYDETMMLHSTMRQNATLDDLKRHTKAIALASKSGFLTKRGGNIKTWKLRWFVLVRNEFSYYESRESEQPIKTLNLEECSKMNLCDIPGKQNCFFLEFPDRTWFFSANSAKDCMEWTSIIDWKMNQIKK